MTKLRIVPGTMTSLEVLQWNCHRSNYATDSLKISKEGRSVWLLQEPHTYKNSVSVRIPGFKTYFKSPVVRNRSCVIAKQDVKLLLNEDLSSDDFTVCLLEEKKSAKLIVSGYLDIERPIIQEKLINIVNYAKENNFDIILALDSNAHSTVWGMEHANQRGVEFEEFLAINELYVVNEGNIATFENAVRNSIIDITVTNKPSSITNWKVEEDLIYSDHRKITFEITSLIDTEEKSTRNLRNVNWFLFKSKLNKVKYTVVSKWNKNNLNMAAEEWSKTVIETLDQVAPRKIVKNGYKRNDWFDVSLKNQRSNVHVCFSSACPATAATPKEHLDNQLKCLQNEPEPTFITQQSTKHQQL